jgi:hypothetical protein
MKERVEAELAHFISTAQAQTEWIPLDVNVAYAILAKATNPAIHFPAFGYENKQEFIQGRGLPRSGKYTHSLFHLPKNAGTVSNRELGEFRNTNTTTDLLEATILWNEQHEYKILGSTAEFYKLNRPVKCYSKEIPPLEPLTDKLKLMTRVLALLADPTYHPRNQLEQDIIKKITKKTEKGFAILEAKVVKELVPHSINELRERLEFFKVDYRDCFIDSLTIK